MKSFLTGGENPLLSKALLVMKMTTFLLVVCALQVSATGFGQEKLNLKYKNAEIAGILMQIEKQTHYRFLYNDQLRAIRQKVNIDVENADIHQALDNLFSQTILTYRFMANNLIVINEANVPRDKKVSGRITDQTGTPLSGVSVNIKNTSRGTVTDEQGRFTLNVDNGDVLVFSYVGFEPQELRVGDRMEFNVSLASSASNLENIVVIGYGTVRKRDLTGAVASLKGDEVKKVPAGNVMESVQGKVAGVDITRMSGAAGSNVNVTVRGNRSILAQNTPLFIVDGIQYPTFQDINPNDIQSMEVLKDASSTAIYGSRGANGVIIITTKRGSAGKVRVAANAYYGVNDVAGYPKPMTGPQFADLKRQAARTAGQWNSIADDSKVFTAAADLVNVQNGVNTYWPGLILQTGSQQDYGVSVGAGSEKTKVFFSFDYFKEKGVLNNDYSGRYTLRLNIDQTVAGTFKVGLQSQLTYYDENRRTDNILTVANKVIPYFTAYNADGALIKFPGNANQPNPLLQDEPGAFINKFNTTRILSSAYAEWKPVNNLTLRSNLGITTSSSRNGMFQGENTIQRSLSTGSLASITNGTGVDLIWENIITWNKKFGEHNLDITGVTSYLTNKTDSSFAQGTGQLLPGQSFYALLNNPSNISINSNYVGSSLVSGAFRLNYGFKGKYLLTLTGRADGASVLSEENRWSFFPSAAAAWRIIDEPFMASQNLLSDLKLRVSYGVAGNSAVRPYSTQSGLILIPYSWNDQTIQAYGFNPQTGNRDLKWELTGTQNIGLDLALFKNRIVASVDYYDSKTRDLLLLRPLPGTSGFLRVIENVGRTRNKGVEVTLRTVNLQGNNFNWTSSITYTRNKERIVDLVNGQNDIAANLFIGHPVKSFYDYQKQGIWQIPDSAAARGFGYKPGDIRVADISGDKGLPDGRIDANYDRVVVGSTVPRYTLGFSNDISFKNFDLNIYVFARVGQTFVSDYANKFEPNAIENGANVDYWTPENATNSYPRPNINISRASMPFATTLGYMDGSFVKIRNITLGYTLPKAITQRFHISSLRWYASAKNYFTFAKVDDYDPEGEGSFDRPLSKLIVTGINIEF